MSIIGKNIKKIRVLKNLNQQAMGDLFGIGRGSIGSYEEGRAEPKLETLIKIAEYFKLSIDMLLTKELTVNDLSGYANKISKHTDYVEVDSSLNQPNKKNNLFLEQRVQMLEEKIAALEYLLKNSNSK